MSDEREEYHREEQRLAAVLRSVTGDAAPVDQGALDALREQSLAAFVAAETESQTDERPTPAATHLPKRSRMMTIAIRGLAACGAAAAALVAWLNLGGPGPAQGAPFSEVVAGLRNAKTLELRITKGDQAAQVLVRAPGLVRYETMPDRYRISAGSRLWEIDETNNTAVAGDSPWFLNPQEQVDLLGLLEVGVTDGSDLWKAHPAGPSKYDNRACVLYRVDLPGKDRNIQVEAFVDADKNELLGIIARRAGDGDAGPPLAELQLLAMNGPVDETKFVVAASLTEDGRIGKITDSQGVVTLRPMTAQRWTPVCRETLLKPGDWLRTDIRGANAVKVRLSTEVELTLGPGSLLECVSPAQARLHSGEAQVNIPKPEKDKAAASFELLAPRQGSEKLADAAKKMFRVDRQEKLALVKQPPKWLAGFEGTSSNESLGSLIVNLPDGRNEPLTVGYHKVSVEIRDQIARTTIEESFVNHTNSRLEGVFHFPLPQDASISGFGMWIGDDLVEADIVEKQRAREIYETILRERRDPGLLEWTVGNLFKARVFPIEANAEKRVKIVYTQVLPLRANRYSYTYGLRSDLLRTKPLRELSLQVTVNSALPIKSVACPTHSARTQQTAHSAQVEFTAQEYTPTRDFEAVFEIDGKQSDVVVVPHRRGDDGYLLMQLSPPAPDGNWQRQVLPDGQPLTVVLLCDTSGSMDSEKRKQQMEFVTTILSSLGEKDRFLLAAADVATAWAGLDAKRPDLDALRPLPPSADNIAQARDFLENRISLGWTNLDQAFEAVLKKSPAGAQIVYIGDGIVTAGERDPAAAARRLARLVAQKQEEKRDEQSARTFHAVTVGNIYEKTVLNAIAGIGGGSVRAIAGDQTPQIVALELLNEIAQPGLRDLNIEFRGLKVAAIYPERLPNVAAGTQQIIVGRYLPTGKDQQGEIIVTGKRGTEPVRYVAKLNFKDAEEGNSFIPRLWARSHLDHLLQQGQSQAIRDQIIGLSEEFHIITPFTSLLVLETDADRERFGVKRRYEMRDGERFFQQGQDNALYELAQQQMKRAGDWRVGLRRQVLRQLATLGRDPRIWQQVQQQWGRITSSTETDGRAGYDTSGNQLFVSGGSSFITLSTNAITQSSGITLDLNGRNWYTGGVTSGNGQDSGYFYAGVDLSLSNNDFITDYDGMPHREKDREFFLGDSDPIAGSADELGGPHPDSATPPLDSGRGENFESNDESILLGFDMPSKIKATGGEEWNDDINWSEMPFAEHEKAGRRFILSGGKKSRDNFGLFGYLGLNGDSLYRQNYQGYYQNYTAWLNMLFPALPGPAGKRPKPLPDPAGWSPEALTLAKSLLRKDALAKLPGGIELRRVTDNFNPRWSRQTAHTTDLTLYGPTAWLTRPLETEGQTLVNYCNDQERGVFSPALLLGRVRKSVPADLSTVPFFLNDGSISSLVDAFRWHQARVEQAGENRAVLVFSVPDSTSQIRYTIDTAKHVIIKYESLDDGQPITTTTFSDFVEVGGTWWAGKATTTNAEGNKTSQETFEIKSLTKEQLVERIKTESAQLPQVQSLRLPLPSLKVARQRVTDGGANFEDRIVMTLYYALSQQWDEVLKQVDAAEKLAADKPGIRWLRTVLLVTMRRNEEARQRLIENAKQLAAKAQPQEAYLADFILNQAQSVTAPAEFFELLSLLKPVYDRVPATSSAQAVYQDRLANSYDTLNRQADSLVLRKKLAEENPWDYYRQTTYAQRLLQAGRGAEAYAWLDQALAHKEHEKSAEDSLRAAYADLYRTQARWEDLLKFTTAWIGRQPETPIPYQMHLSTLIYNDRLKDADALASQWLTEGRIEGKLTPVQLARLSTAISYAQGNSYNLSFQRMEARWHEPLAETVRYFIRHKHHIDIAQRAFDYRLVETDTGDRLRGYFLSLLQTDLANLTTSQIGYLVNSTLNGRIELAQPLNGRKQLNATEIPDDIWRKIADQLRERWTKADEKKGDKATLGNALRSIYAARFSATELLPFLREQIKTAGPESKTGYNSQLFEALLNRKWTGENETEAFALQPQLSNSDEPVERLTAEIGTLHRLVDVMLAWRMAADEAALHDQGETDKLTRIELAKKKAEIGKAARAGLVARLTALAQDEQNPLQPWLRIEQAWLNVQLDQNLDKVAEQCWKILDVAPPKPAEDEELTPVQAQQRLLDAILRQRALTTAMNLAARKTATPAAIERLLKYLDAGIALGGDEAAGWRQTKYQFLIALDRPDNLERELREWIRADVSTAPWRKSLAMLLAERGKLDEAIGLFEAAEKDKLLTAADYRALSVWYQVVDRREAYERAKLEIYKQMPERQLSQMINIARNRWSHNSNQPLPSELDEKTLLAFRAIFLKSANPEQYHYYLREVYAACRDFRLLQILPDSVLGRSPQQIYSCLASLRSHVLDEVRNESTADEIVARIKKLRDGERTPTDLRALDLLEALVERRSSEVQNQRGPHVEACLAAMQRAFQHKWSDGEPRLMSGFLFQFGPLADPKLVDEQLREARALVEMAPANSRDHLDMTSSLAKLLFFTLGRKLEGAQVMEAEVRAYDLAHQGVWPYQDDSYLESYASMLSADQLYADAEKLYQKYLAKPENGEQKKWLEDRLLYVYDLALELKGEVSLGSGATLLKNIVALCERKLESAPDENVRYNIVTRMVNTFDIGNRHKIDGTTELMRTFTLQTIPALLKRQVAQYHSTATAPLTRAVEILGRREALRYMLERMEQWPQRLEISGENAWNAFSHLARYRNEAVAAHEAIGDLEPRILKLAIAELKRSLRTGDNRVDAIYMRYCAYFWTEKAADFARAAEEVYQEFKTSGRLIMRVANYLRSGLQLNNRSIEMLLIALKDGLLDQGAQVQLVDWLHQDNRHAESIPILEPLIAAAPDTMHYRILLMRAYYYAKRPQQLVDLVKQIDRHFHQGGRWTEGNINEFAMVCVECQLYEQAIGYLKEAIALHQRSNPGSGLGDQILSQLYDYLAQAHAALHQTKEAVDAASAAIVCWSPRHDHRKNALDRLRLVLTGARDLSDYVKYLDQESAKTGQDSPVLRKTLGKVYQERRDYPKAIAQYQLASQLQSTDKEIHQALIGCYDASQQPREATKQLLVLIDFDRHDLALYQQLADRLKNDEAEAERAATSIIEAGPNEAENHAALAELRQKQDRWTEALPHWQEVAALRRLEPTGLVKLATAQAHLKQWAAVRVSLDALRKMEWPSRFNNLTNDLQAIEQQIPK